MKDIVEEIAARLSWHDVGLMDVHLLSGCPVNGKPLANVLRCAMDEITRLRDSQAAWESIALDARLLLSNVHPSEVYRRKAMVDLAKSGIASMGEEPPRVMLDDIDRRIAELI